MFLGQHRIQYNLMKLLGYISFVGRTEVETEKSGMLQKMRHESGLTWSAWQGCDHHMESRHCDCGVLLPLLYHEELSCFRVLIWCLVLMNEEVTSCLLLAVMTTEARTCFRYISSSFKIFTVIRTIRCVVDFLC